MIDAATPERSDRRGTRTVVLAGLSLVLSIFAVVLALPDDGGERGIPGRSAADPR